MIVQNKQKDFPTIYLRYLNGMLMYIGESSSFIKARHVREDNLIGDFDIVKVLKAPKNLDRRRYWEAYLILKLKPSYQINLKTYKYRYDKANNIKTHKRYHKIETKEKTIKKIGKEFHLIQAYQTLKIFKQHLNMAKWEDKKN